MSDQLWWRDDQHIFDSFGVWEQLSIPDVDQVTIARFLDLKQTITFAGANRTDANCDVKSIG